MRGTVMREPSAELYYGDYLRLDLLLAAQHPESRRRGREAHDETLFIIVHQAYELWFKQILHELRSVLALFGGGPLDEKTIGVIVTRLGRIVAIQKLINQQIGIVETITPLDFLDFRDTLIPASGFQSVQFREIELRLGLAAQGAYGSPGRLRPADADYLRRVAGETSLFERVDEWLARMPFLKFEGFDFWRSYRRAVEAMLARDRRSIRDNRLLSDEERRRQFDELEATRQKFTLLFEPEGFERLREQGFFHLRQPSVLAALFIQLYRDEPILHLPFRLLVRLMDIDEQLADWRNRHALMAQRLLGSKIGTGGTSGHDYLRDTVDKKRVFRDLFHLSTFLIPRSSLPLLPEALKRSLDFRFSERAEVQGPLFP
jgi:tryptophan 2,3-dioxygenase